MKANGLRLLIVLSLALGFFAGRLFRSAGHPVPMASQKRI